MVLNQICLGAGFGLLSTPSLVGAQAMVPWEKRGVVTSSIVFSRNLGQSLGATIFGAIVNNSMRRQFQSAPDELKNLELNIMEILNNPAISEGSKAFLRTSISNSFDYIFWTIGFLGILICLALLRAPKIAEKVD